MNLSLQERQQQAHQAAIATLSAYINLLGPVTHDNHIRVTAAKKAYHLLTGAKR